jgi:iron complex outermembrane recepter protein
VGVYLDEMPVTTIGNNLDLHVYDIARVEALAGPQGTLFGASSMAGTMRLITNKPDPTHFEAGYDLTGDTYTKGAAGGKVEGFANIPLTDYAAIRLVGWDEHEGGYINIVPNSAQYYPTSGVIRSDAQFVQKNSNYVDTSGGRIALKVNLNEQWTVTPTVMTQSQSAHGQNAYTPNAVTVTPVYGGPAGSDPMTLGGSGDLNISRFALDLNRDNWWMSTLVVEGKIADFDLTYAAGYIHRNVHNYDDYSDYSLFYDAKYVGYTSSPWAAIFTDQGGAVINPAQIFTATELFVKQSQELRLATPTDWAIHGVVGAFSQRQYNDSDEKFLLANLSPAFSISGSPGINYRDHSFRTDRDTALFTDLSYDITPRLVLTGGIRFFHYDNTVNGFSGFSELAYIQTGRPGENQCFTPIVTNNPSLPCENVSSRATKSSNTHRLNLTYKIDDDKMIYGSWSTGFRPGGVNRLPTVPSYNPDYLTNFEAGTKTTWLDHRLRINAALFYEEWKNAQFGIAGPYAITEIVNAGKAAIKGLEAEVQYVPFDGLTLSSSITYLNAKLLSNACQFASPSGTCQEPYDDPQYGLESNSVLAPSGSRLPVSAKIKGNSIARYEWNVGDYRAHMQIALAYQSNALSSLQSSDEAIVGGLPGYGTADLAVGVARDRWHTELYIQNATDNRASALRYTTCVPSVCNLVNVIPIKPRLVGLNFGQKF